MISTYCRFVIMNLLAISIPFSAGAAPWEHSQRLSKMTSVYDVTQVETVTGTVERVFEKKPSSSKNPNSLGYHLILKTEKESIDVHLGPTWFLKGIERIIAVGDVVTVVGSRVEAKAAEKGEARLREISASEINRKDSIILRLRDPNGKPGWSIY